MRPDIARHPSTENPGSHSRRSQRRGWLAGLTALAGLRVLLLCATYPLYTPTDEELHFDAIFKFAHRPMPRQKLEGFDQLPAALIVLYHSPEYLRNPAAGRPFLPLPWWCDPSAESVPSEARFALDYWFHLPNVERQSPPVYYWMGAAWYWLGRGLGIQGVHLPYWLRSLNAVAYSGFILVAYWFVRRAYPENDFLQLAVLVVLAVFPQDVLFSMNPNAVFPLTMATALLLLLILWQEPERSWRWYLGAGAAVAATALTGFGQFLIVVPALAVGLRNSVRSASKTAVFVSVAFVPIILWLVYNRLELGTWSGSLAKQQFLGWSVKPWGEIWSHPLFSLSGIKYFAGGLARTWWRGEIPYGGTLKSSWGDHVFLWSSLICLGVWLVVAIRRRRRLSFADACSLWMVAGSIGFLAALSLRFNFGNSFYPSQALPFFISGRLVLGTLLPFAILYLRGLEFFWSPLRRFVSPWAGVGALVACMLFAQAQAAAPLAQSRYNLFAVLSSRSCGH